MKLHIYNEEIFDSLEEIHFAMWLDELKATGYVESWERSDFFDITPPLQIPYISKTLLKTKVRVENRIFTLLQKFTYTPDFKINWTTKGLQQFVSPIMHDNSIRKFDPKKWFFGDWTATYVEVKPMFDMHEKISKFSIIQKIIWFTQKIFVDLIQPEALFKGTFMPLEVMDEYKYKKAPTGKNKGKKSVGDWKCDFVPKTLKEFLESDKKWEPLEQVKKRLNIK